MRSIPNFARYQADDAEHPDRRDAVLATLEAVRVPPGHCMLFVPQDAPGAPSPCALAGHCTGAVPAQTTTVPEVLDRFGVEVPR